VHVKAPLEGLLNMPDETLALEPVTTFPLLSSTVTTGCCAHAVAAGPPPGCVVNTSVVAVLTLKLELVAEVSPLAVARSAQPIPVALILHPA